MHESESTIMETIPYRILTMDLTRQKTELVSLKLSDNHAIKRRKEE